MSVSLCVHLYIYMCIWLRDPMLPAGVEWRHWAGVPPPRAGGCGDFSAGVAGRSAQGPEAKCGRKRLRGRAEPCGAGEKGWI